MVYQNMKQNDLTLIVVISLLAICWLFLNNNSTLSNNIAAKVYYENQLILTIDMNQDGEYDVEGANGKVHIVVMDHKIKVEEENSPKHLCSKQGFISSSNQAIVCLPNKILIRMESDDSLDAVIG